MVSVIIPVHNGRQTLPACLQALQCQTHLPDEIIVVNDGSTDDTVAVASQFGVTVLSQARAGPAAARNYGARVAQGDILLFTDADCAPFYDWVERMLAPFADPTVAGVKGEYRTRQPELVARFVQQEYQDRYDRMAGQPQIDFLDTYAAGFRRQPFLAAGGFDIKYLISEDVEFSFRLAEQGFRMMHVPGAKVYHHHNRTLREYIIRKFRIGYWRALIVRRYPSRLVCDSHTPQILKVQMGLAALGGVLLVIGGIIRSLSVVIGGMLVWVLLLLSGFSLYGKIIHRDAPVLMITPLLLFIRAWSLGLGFLVGSLRFLFWRL